MALSAVDMSSCAVVRVPEGQEIYKGPYYLVISNDWRAIKDFVQCQISFKVNTYIHLYTNRKDEGWIRVAGIDAFREVKKVFHECRFRSRLIVVHDQYQMDAKTVMVKAPHPQDKSYILGGGPGPVVRSPAIKRPYRGRANHAHAHAHSGPSQRAPSPQQTSNAMTIPTAPRSPPLQGTSEAQSWRRRPQLTYTTPPPSPPSPHRGTEAPASPRRRPALAKPVQVAPIDLRKFSIKWNRRMRLPSGDDMYNLIQIRDKMGQIIRDGLSDPDSLEDVDAHPGSAVAKFTSFAAAQRAFKDLQKVRGIHPRSWLSGHGGGLSKTPEITVTPPPEVSVRRVVIYLSP
ncbi:hypothetical protein B0T19DRAFT_454556 [Cercophora scortea]|uniref:Uncharacterized protein n=1 Tax=Cercophora scortea TaxID=314031 RepID=A0AAE0J5L8_9PEZI|nr:hypothetical protein B0T19DRAFT_454556 [Cercophora scortea]